MVKATAIIQARMTSTRLPGKVMMSLSGKPVIYHIIDRLGCCVSLESVILATSNSAADDPLEMIATEMGISCYRGSLDDVLARFYLAALVEKPERIVRICADSPLLDSEIIDNAVLFHADSGTDIVKTINMPLGLGTEVFTYASLEAAYQNATEHYQREHVTPYIYENFDSKELLCGAEKSPYRLTLDTKEDFTVIQKIYDILYTGDHNFHSGEIIRVLLEHPEIAKINQDIQQIHVPLKVKGE